MSIREIAKLLYRLQKEIEKLEASLNEDPTSEEIKEKLRQLKAERDKARAILDGMKKKPNIRMPR
jgi:DNA-directed RNA polymerase specialized sigma subunit